MYGEAADDLHRRRQDSDLEDASYDRTDIAAEAGMDKVLVNHKHESVAAMTRPNEVTEYMVAIGWMSGDLVCAVSSVKMRQQRSHCRTLLTGRDKSRQFHETHHGMSHDSLGHCESAIKEVEKQIRVLIFHTLRADHKCDSDRRAAWTITQCTVKAKEQTSFFKWMSKDYRGEVVRFTELSWFRSIAMQSKLANQWERGSFGWKAATSR